MNRNAKLRTALAAALIATLPLGALAQTEAASSTMANDLPPVDKAFVQAASSAGSTEIDAAKLATKQSQDKDVKSFAHHMMVDHTKLTMQLKMATPHGQSAVRQLGHLAIDALKPLKGKDFDKMYIQKVGVEGRQKAVAAFQKEAQGRSEPRP